MNLLVALFLLEIAEACAPSISSPLSSISLVPSSLSSSSLNLASSPQLPPVSFQMDNEVPHVDDYSDDSMTIQKDSVLPLRGEKLKNRFSLFDLFRPLSVPATTLPILINEKVVDVVSMNLTFSPPVHWTFCVPSCGVNDQAVDAEDAYEKARDDVLEAVQSSCRNAGITCNSDSLDIQYFPESVLTEDFGAYFDLSGNRYKISGKTIPYRINSLNPGIIKSFTLPMKISFRPSTPISEKNAQGVRQKVVDYLAARKSVHIATNFI